MLRKVAVSSYQEAYQTYLGYPVILGRQGVVAPVHLSLSAEENRLLEESANLIRNRVQEAVSFLREKRPILESECFDNSVYGWAFDYGIMRPTINFSGVTYETRNQKAECFAAACVSLVTSQSVTVR